jgi:hypothetical protein
MGDDLYRLREIQGAEFWIRRDMQVLAGEHLLVGQTGILGPDEATLS